MCRCSRLTDIFVVRESGINHLRNRHELSTTKTHCNSLQFHTMLIATRKIHVSINGQRERLTWRGGNTQSKQRLQNQGQLSITVEGPPGIPRMILSLELHLLFAGAVSMVGIRISVD